ncbi:hypothetical protein BGW38_001688 [Lunasporangiospora selenospora]|uniref:Uncharacterized protein n=1 Tax=Lunasporangiospora selenospora TaxID=979761 RepID=A0A9P6FTN2_9FUNG|nr:hypothetical protein BGW38_001688 [Lunasporangiospora selenospora]
MSSTTIWHPIPGRLQSVSVTDKTNIWGVTLDLQLCRFNPTDQQWQLVSVTTESAAHSKLSSTPGQTYLSRSTSLFTTSASGSTASLTSQPIQTDAKRKTQPLSTSGSSSSLLASLTNSLMGGGGQQQQQQQPRSSSDSGHRQGLLRRDFSFPISIAETESEAETTIQVAAAADGTVVRLDRTLKAWYLIGPKDQTHFDRDVIWIDLGHFWKCISVASVSQVWGLSDRGDVFHGTMDRFSKLESTITSGAGYLNPRFTQLAVGQDGVVIATDAHSGFVFRLKTHPTASHPPIWNALPGTGSSSHAVSEHSSRISSPLLHMVHCSISTADFIVGVTQDGLVYRFTNGRWVALGGGATMTIVDVGTDGYVMGVDCDGDLLGCQLENSILIPGRPNGKDVLEGASKFDEKWETPRSPQAPNAPSHPTTPYQQDVSKRPVVSPRDLFEMAAITAEKSRPPGRLRIGIDSRAPRSEEELNHSPVTRSPLGVYSPITGRTGSSSIGRNELGRTDSQLSKRSYASGSMSPTTGLGMFQQRQQDSRSASPRPLDSMGNSPVTTPFESRPLRVQTSFNSDLSRDKQNGGWDPLSVSGPESDSTSPTDYFSPQSGSGSMGYRGWRDRTDELRDVSGVETGFSPRETASNGDCNYGFSGGEERVEARTFDQTNIHRNSDMSTLSTRNLSAETSGAHALDTSADRNMQRQGSGWNMMSNGEKSRWNEEALALDSYGLTKAKELSKDPYSNSGQQNVNMGLSVDVNMARYPHYPENGHYETLDVVENGSSSGRQSIDQDKKDWILAHSKGVASFPNHRSGYSFDKSIRPFQQEEQLPSPISNPRTSISTDASESTWPAPQPFQGHPHSHSYQQQQQQHRQQQQGVVGEHWYPTATYSDFKEEILDTELQPPEEELNREQEVASSSFLGPPAPNFAQAHRPSNASEISLRQQQEFLRLIRLRSRPSDASTHFNGDTTVHGARSSMDMNRPGSSQNTTALPPPNVATRQSSSSSVEPTAVGYTTALEMPTKSTGVGPLTPVGRGSRGEGADGISLQPSYSSTHLQNYLDKTLSQPFAASDASTRRRSVATGMQEIRGENMMPRMHVLETQTHNGRRASIAVVSSATGRNRDSYVMALNPSLGSGSMHSSSSASPAPDTSPPGVSTNAAAFDARGGMGTSVRGVTGEDAQGRWIAGAAPAAVPSNNQSQGPIRHFDPDHAKNKCCTIL